MSVARLGRRALSRGINGFAGARVALPEGRSIRDLPRQAIFYGNHSSHLDFLTIWASLPADLQQRARPVAAKDYWGSGLRKRVVEGVFNAYLVDRHGSSRERTRASDSGVSPKGQLSGMTEVLDAGDSLIIFPEGTRGDGETIAEFRGGLYRLALHNAAIPVVPVTLINLGRILPKGATVPVPHLSTLTFGEPIQVADGEDQAAFLARARQILVQELADHAAGDGDGDDDGDGEPDGRQDRR